MLPLLLTVSVFFISQGISVPNFSDLQEAYLSSLQEAKPRSLVVVKGQIKSPQSRVVKAAQFFDLCGKVDVVNKAVVHVVTLNHASHPAVSVPDAAVPARAPPA